MSFGSGGDNTDGIVLPMVCGRNRSDLIVLPLFSHEQIRRDNLGGDRGGVGGDGGV